MINFTESHNSMDFSGLIKSQTNIGMEVEQPVILNDENIDMVKNENKKVNQRSSNKTSPDNHMRKLRSHWYQWQRIWRSHFVNKSSSLFGISHTHTHTQTLERNCANFFSNKFFDLLLEINHFVFIRFAVLFFFFLTNICNAMQFYCDCCAFLWLLLYCERQAIYAWRDCLEFNVSFI